MKGYTSCDKLINYTNVSNEPFIIDRVTIVMNLWTRFNGRFEITQMNSDSLISPDHTLNLRSIVVNSGGLVTGWKCDFITWLMIIYCVSFYCCNKNIWTGDNSFWVPLSCVIYICMYQYWQFRPLGRVFSFNAALIFFSLNTRNFNFFFPNSESDNISSFNS